MSAASEATCQLAAILSPYGIPLVVVVQQGVLQMMGEQTGITPDP